MFLRTVKFFHTLAMYLATFVLGSDIAVSYELAWVWGIFSYLITKWVLDNIYGED